jgi:hypothetical protein
MNMSSSNTSMFLVCGIRILGSGNIVFITYGKKSLKIPKRHTSKDNQNDGQKKKPKRKLLIHKTLHRPD